MSIRLSKHHFWRWFLEHNQEYLALYTKSQKEARYWLNELSAHLRAYYKFLHFSIYTSKEPASGVLTITVGGKKQYFGYVDRIAALAPAIPAWSIQALEAPVPIDFCWEQELAYTGIDPHELWCKVPDEGCRPGIDVYHRLYTVEKRWHFTTAAESAVYNVLGERVYGSDIGAISVGNLSSAPKEVELIKLEELPAYLPSGASGLVVDAKGRIWER